MPARNLLSFGIGRGDATTKRGATCAAPLDIAHGGNRGLWTEYLFSDGEGHCIYFAAVVFQLEQVDAP
jgi:hypothetical protein